MNLNFDMLDDLGVKLEENLVPEAQPTELATGAVAGEGAGEDEDLNTKSIFNFDALQENLNIEVIEPDDKVMKKKQINIKEVAPEAPVTTNSVLNPKSRVEQERIASKS